jgi:photosystem II stability/assembly factor-like uncharacterized protein
VKKMKALYISLLIFLLPINLFAQWFPQNSGTTQQLEDISFIDSNNGLAVGNSTILRTTDGGSTWLLVGAISLKGVTLMDAGIGYAVSGYGTILKTVDGGSNWLLQNSGTTYALSGVSFIDSLTGIVVGYHFDGFNGYGIILKTTNGGTNWINQYQGNGPLFDVSFNDVNNAVVVGWGRVLRTTNGGENWLSNTSAWGDGISFSDINNGTCAGWNAGSIRKTTDGGINWLPQNSGTNQWLYGVSSIDENNITVVGDGGTILRTTDGGNNWNSQLSGTTSGLKAVYFTDINTGWVVGQSGTILKTTNGGIPVELTSFLVTAKQNSVLLEWTTATEINNQGFEIERQSIGGEFEKIGYVAGSGTTTEPNEYSFTDNNVSSGTYTYRLKQIDFDGSFEYSKEIEVEISVLFGFSLQQNYPNPFNPNTIIKYQIPELSFATIKVFDVLGKEVVTLVNEEKPAGSYEVEFNSRGLIHQTLPSGIYFYQLKAGSFIESKKMILIK